MVRPVKGFVTEDGKFFDSIKEAKIYEAQLNLAAALVQDEMSEEVILWIDKREAEIKAYIDAKRSVPDAKEPIK